MEFGFSPVSIIAYAARSIASAVASQNSVTEEAVGGIGAGAQALFSGLEIKGAKKNISSLLESYGLRLKFIFLWNK